MNTTLDWYRDGLGGNYGRNPAGNTVVEIQYNKYHIWLDGHEKGKKPHYQGTAPTRCIQEICELIYETELKRRQ
jgi:hypothetical protein